MEMSSLHVEAKSSTIAARELHATKLQSLVTPPENDLRPARGSRVTRWRRRAEGRELMSGISRLPALMRGTIVLVQTRRAEAARGRAHPRPDDVWPLLPRLHAPITHQPRRQRRLASTRPVRARIDNDFCCGFLAFRICERGCGAEACRFAFVHELRHVRVAQHVERRHRDRPPSPASAPALTRNRTNARINARTRARTHACRPTFSPGKAAARDPRAHHRLPQRECERERVCSRELCVDGRRARDLHRRRGRTEARRGAKCSSAW
eukprot:238047-Pleurochrysis_carterae.AAC.3